MSPPRLCIGCSRKKAIPGTSRCPDCTRPHGWQLRPSSEPRNYRGDWPKISKARLKRHPDCVVCGEPATATDHIDRRGGDEEENLQSLCSVHHAEKTAREGHEGRRRKLRGG